MGHIRLRDKRAAAIPNDVRMGIKLRRTQPPPTGVGEPGCTPLFNGWTVTVTAISGFTEEWTFEIQPSPGVQLCGNCLEWVYDGAIQDGISLGTEPVVSIAAASNCVGVIGTVAAQDPAPFSWLLFLTASINGQPFGTVAKVIIECEPPEVPSYSLSGTGGSWGGPMTGDPIILNYNDTVGQQMIGTISIDTPVCYPYKLFLWNIVDANGIVLNFVDSSTSDPFPTIGFEFFGDLVNSGTVTITPTLDGMAYGPQIIVEPF